MASFAGSRLKRQPLVAREKGLKAALDWRDSPFQDYASAPAGSAKPSGAAW